MNVEETMIAHRPGLSDIVERYEGGLAALKTARAALEGYDLKVTTGFRDNRSPELMLKQDAWRSVATLFDLKAYMPTKEYDDLTTQLFSQNEHISRLPEPNHANIFETVRGWLESMPERRVASIMEAYNYLRPRTSRLKTNKPPVIGKRAIVWVGSSYWRDFDRLDMVEKVFAMLDGKRPVSSNEGIGSKARTPWTEQTSGEESESEYFHVKVYLNGNAHLTFKRPDLVDVINETAGRNWIPEAQTA